MNEIELTIIAPMYNEHDNLISTLERIRKTMSSFQNSWEMIFVNDGSTDESNNIAKKLEKEVDNLTIISYKNNRGRGYALRKGFAKANGRYIVTIDFDLSYSPRHILNIYDALVNDDSIDSVFGSAYMPGGKSEGVPFFRLWISKLSNKFFSFFWPQKIYTSTCVLRGYKKNVIKSLSLRSNDKEIHLEILSKMIALGYNIKEIPATLRTRIKGSSTFKLSSFLVSHLNFSLYERPAKLFGLLGLISLFIGLISSFFLLYQYFQGELNPSRPLVNFSIVLLISGLLLMIFSIITFQISNIRSELLLIQKNIKK